MEGPEKPIHGSAPTTQGMETGRMYKINGNCISEIAFSLTPDDRFTASISL